MRQARGWTAALVAGVLALLAVAGLAAGSKTSQVVAPTPCVPPPAGVHQVTVDGRRVPVLLHVPPGAAPPGGRALIVVLGGAGEDGRNIAAYTGYSALADAKDFLVAYPTASGGTRPFWNVSGKEPGKPDDVAYLRKVITTLTGPDGCANPRRVGVTGVSNGGGMAARLACDAADLISAAAPVAGGYSALPTCVAPRPVPMLEIHSLADHVVPYAGKGASGAGSVSSFLADWRRRDGCGPHAQRSMPAGDVTELRWTCAHGVVVHDRVSDVDHGWPGEASLKPFSSTVRTWRFLTSFTKA